MVALSALLIFVLILITDIFVLKAEKKRHPAFIKNFKIVDVDLFNKEGITIPVDTYVSKGHTYAEFIQDKTIKVGVDEFVSSSLGEIKVEKIAAKGTKVKVGDIVISANVGGNTINFSSPVEGVVKVVNDNLLGNIINDPYGKDWGLMITPNEFEKTKRSLKINEELAEWMKTELKRFKDYLYGSLNPELAGATMYDGGTIVKGAVAQLDNSAVTKFQKEFLSL